MRMDPYPDAVIHRGLYKREPRETAKPILEEAMMYTSVVGVEMMEGLAITSDTVDRMVLEASERKTEVDGGLVRLRHRLGQTEQRAAVVEEWKEDVTTHITGGKCWCPRWVNCKYIVRKWTKYLPFTHLVNCNYIQNCPSQFLYSFPSPGNAQYIHSFPSHVIMVS